MDGQRFCALPERLVLDANVNRRAATVSWWVDSVPAGLNRDQVRQTVAQAMAAWAAVAGISASESVSAAQADLLVTSSRIDGPLGILAQCELPGPSVQHCQVDSFEKWVIHLGPSVPTGQIDLVRVLTHEIGHFWGVGHIAQGNLMAPIYSATIDRPQSGDIQEMQARYGPPAPTHPTGEPDLPDQMWVIGQSGNVTAKFKLTRI